MDSKQFLGGIPIKVFYRTRKSHPKIVAEAQKTPKSPNNPRGKKSKAEGITISSFETYYKA